MPKPLHESLKLAEAASTDARSGRMSIQILSPGWGGSGYYSQQVCESAAPLFAVGTQMFIDHPHQDGSGLDERGNRSVRDIAAVLTEAGRWDPTSQSVVAECRVTAPYRDLLTDEAVVAHIGLSLRGSATDITVGEAEGRSGPIIEGLANIQSVDFVTRAGRGGKVLKVLESAVSDAVTEAFTEDTARLQLAEARNVGQWIESRLHLELTRIADDMFGDGRLTRPERISLSSAVGDALTAFVTNLEASAPDLYKRDLWAEPTVLLAASEARHVLAARPGGNNPDKSQEDTMGNISIEESEHRRLTEAAGRVETLETERDSAITERDQLKAAEAERVTEARIDRAADIIEARAADAGVTIGPRKTRELLTALPVVEGALDETAFTKTVDEAAATIKQAAGAGKVRGFGADATDVTESEDGEPIDLDKHLAESLGDLMPTQPTHQAKGA